MNPSIIDETDNQYGSWTVIRRSGNLPSGGAVWWCRCACGTERGVSGVDLRSGASAGCGCARRETHLKTTAAKFFGKDETDNVFGRWKVLRRDETSKGAAARWICQCECGTIKSVSGIGLRSGSHSCGCLKVERVRAANNHPPGEACLAELIGIYRRGARKRNLDFGLTAEECRHLLTQGCFYCGAPPIQVHRPSKSRSNGRFPYNGIDRVDSALGYSVANVVTACTRCNIAKASMSQAEFIDLCNRVAARHPVAVN